MSDRHVVLPGTLRPQKSTTVRRRDSDPKSMIEVTVTLRGLDLPEEAGAPRTGMTYAEFEAKHGTSQADADKVSRVLGGYGLKVEEVSLGTSSMKLTGTIREMEAAFGTDLAVYHSADQGEFRGREGELHVPADLDGIITGVFGLDQRQVARRKPTALAGGAPAAVTSPVTPDDLEARYDFPPGDGAGQVIGVAEFGGAYFATDLAAYAAKFGRPTPTVDIVPLNYNPPTLPQIRSMPQAQQDRVLNEAFEVMMDVEVIAGLCPNATLSVYFATFDQKGWVDTLNRVIQDRPVALSVSWGLAEDDPNWSAAARAEINKRLQAATALGITVCVASGDDGSGDQSDDGAAHIDFPSSSPFVLAVGGTMLAGSASEVVWWESPGRRTPNGGGSTGGGVSVFFDRPAWQTVQIPSLNAGSIDGRVIPDVAALAGAPLYDLIFLGQDQPNGGTSASAPVWAALVARLDAKLPTPKRQRFLAPLLYLPGPGGQIPGQSAFNDITSGDNTSNPEPGVGYNAAPGFDAVSGWGTPDGVKLVAAL